MFFGITNPFLAVAFLALAGTAFGCAKRLPSTRPDGLLVTIDTLRGDRWGCTGDPAARSPVADRLARRGTLAFEGRASAPITLPSHTTMMTGLAPVSHSVRDNGLFRLGANAGQTLAEVCRGAGYATSAFVSAFPLASRFGLDRGFDHYDDFLGGEEGAAFGHLPERTAAQTVARVRRSFERNRQPGLETPLFTWVHFFDPHAPYFAPAPWTPALAGDAYRAEIAFADRELGRLLAFLDERRGGRARCVVLTSDHGEGLGEHGERTHGVLLHAATLRVPIVALGAAFEPRLLAAPVSLERIPRTMLELLGIEAPFNDDSAPSLADAATPVLSETMYPYYNFGWRALRSWEATGWKLVSGARDRLYATSEGPGETRDIAPEHAPEAARLRGELLTNWDLRLAKSFETSVSLLSNEDVEALRSLGYAAGSAASAASSANAAFTTGPDPEDLAPIVDQVNIAITLLGEGEAREAALVLRAVVDRDPKNRLAWETLGGAELACKNALAARDAFFRALALGPNPVSVRIDLAEAERLLGNPDGERLALRAALAADSLSVPARSRLSRIAFADGDSTEGFRLLEDAVRLRPRSAPTHEILAEAYDAGGRRDRAVEHWRRALELDPDGESGNAARANLTRLGVRVP